MRILNKMKKAMLVLAASLFTVNVAFAEEVAGSVADTLKADAVNVLELGKTYIIGASGMHKVSFTAPADGFLNLTTSQRINRTGLKINGATSTFTNENGGFSKKGMAEGSIFEGQFYVSGTPSAENTYSFILTFEEGVPYEPITLSEMYPADGGEWSAAAYYWPNLTSYQGQPYLSFSLPINTTSAVASVKIGEKVYSPLKLYVSSQRMTLQSLPDTLKAAVAEGLIKPGESFQITLTGVEDKEFSANKLADLTFSYTLASTACTGVTPVASTSRTELPQEVVFSFDGEVKIDNAKFFFIDGTGKEIELTGATVEGSSVKIPVTGIEGLLPKTYDIVAKGVTNVDGKVITYGNTVGQLTASYGTSNGYFKPVAEPANWAEVASLKTYTFTLPGEVVYDDSQASSKDITITKLNEATYGWDAVEGVTASYSISGNVITVTLSQEITAAGEYQLTVPNKLFWAKETYNAENLTTSNCYYVTTQYISNTILAYGPTTVTPASSSTVEKLEQIVLAFDEPVDYDAEAKASVVLYRELVDEDFGYVMGYDEIPVGEFALADDNASENNIVLNLGSIDSAGIYRVTIPEGAIWTVADTTKKVGQWIYEYTVEPAEEDPALVEAVETLNALIAEVEAYQKTLDLTDPMSATMNQELTTVIADAKAVAETAESLEAVKNAEGYLNSVYVSVVGGVAGAVIGEAEEVMAFYENPTDEAGLGAAIQKVYEIYSSLGTGMGDVAYTVSDLVAAVEAVKVAQEAFIVENTPVEAEQLLKVLASYDFAAMDVTLATGASAGFAYNAGNGVFNEVFACTTEGLEAFAFQALAAANGKGWSIVNGTGLVLGSGAGRCAALTGLEAGQLVDVYFTGDNLYVGDNDTYPNAKNSAKDIAAIKDTLVAEAGHYQFLMKEDGALALELDRGNAITKIEVSAPATYVIASSWDFETLAPAEDGMTYLTTLADYEKVGQSGWNWASVIATEIGEGLAFTRTATSAKQMGFWLRTKGADKGLACQKDNHTLTVYGLETGSVVVLNTTANAIAGSYKGNFGGEWTAVEDAENGIYEYTMTADGDLNLTVAAGSWVKNITVKKLVQLEVKNKFDFETLAPAEDGMTYLTTLADYEKVGQSGWNWASVIATEIGEGLAFTRTATSAKQMGFWLRTKGADKGLACQKDNHTLTVYGLTTGDVITLNTTANAIAGSYKGNFGGEWTAVEDAENGVYEYTMTADGDLNLTVAAGSWIKNLSVVGPKPDIFVPEIVVSEHADSEVAFVTMTCATEGAEIHYTLNGGADLLYNDTLLLTSNAEIVAWATTEKGKSKTTTINVVAGYVVTPTATITAVDGVNRTVTLASATEGASIVYATSALEEVALTKEMFHKWDGVGADANQTADATTPELGVGVELGAGGMVYGYSTVDYLHYADLTGAVKLVVEGTPGVQLRVLMNRVEHEGALTEVNVTIGTNGKAEVDLTGMEYVHLNAIKTGWGSAAGTITKLAVASVKEGFEAYTEPFVISDNTTVWAIASKKSAIADSLTFASDTLVAELVAGTEVALNAPVFGKVSYDEATQLSVYTLTTNQSSVLCTPSDSITYEFYALDATTGRIPEVASQSGIYKSELTLPLGKLVATAHADGYVSTESYLWLKAPAVLTEVWSVDFDTLAYEYSLEDKYSPTVLADVVGNENGVDLNRIQINDSVPAYFAVQTGTSWLIRTGTNTVNDTIFTPRVDDTGAPVLGDDGTQLMDTTINSANVIYGKGLYSYNSGGRTIAVTDVKRNQIVKIYIDNRMGATNNGTPYLTLIDNGVGEEEVTMTEGDVYAYRIKANGNLVFSMGRYNTIHTIEIYDDPSVTAAPDYSIVRCDGEKRYVGLTSRTLGADIFYAFGAEQYNESQVLVNDTVGGIEPVYETKIDTVIAYGEYVAYTEPIEISTSSYIRTYATYQDVDSDPLDYFVVADGTTVQIAQPVILYTGNTETGEKQFTITVDNSEVISTPTTPIYYTLPGAEEALYDGGTITVKADAYGWMTAVAKLAGYEDSKAARRYIDARESYTEKYEVVDATLETIPAEAGDVEIDYSEDMNVEQLGATAFAGRVYFHRVVEAAVINVSLPTVFNNNCYVTDAAGNKLERGVDYVINEIKAAERPIDGVLTGNMAATAAKGYVVNFLNAELLGKEVIFVSAVKGNIAKGNFTYAQPEAGYKVVTNRTFAAATLDVPAYVLNAEGTAFELVENGAVVAPFQSVILASADICATVGSLSAADGIESIAADKEVKEIKYFTVGGVEVEKPAAGVYIQQIIFTDGTVKSVSVAVK